MCTESTLVPIPDFITPFEFDPSHPEYGIDEQGRRCFRIDSCIVPVLLAVWEAGFKTMGCCCGHGSGRGVISLDLGYARAGLTWPHHCVQCGLLHIEAESKAEK